MVTSAGQVIVGAAKSLIVMFCVQLDAFPQTSVAVHVLTNTAGHSSDAGPSVYATVHSEQASSTVGSPANSGSDDPLSQFTM
jgi:hypothetical protein